MNRRETTARMMCAENSMEGDGCPDCDPVDGCQDWRGFARDYDMVISRIREPTPAQIEAARREIINLTWSWTNGRPKSRDLHSLADGVWRAMVDQLIEESEHGQAEQRRAAEALFASAPD